MSARAQLRTTSVLAVLVGLGAAALWWSNRQVPDIVRDERRARVFSSLRRDQVQRIEIDRGIERFVCRKDGARWLVELGSRSAEADDTEVERMLTEAEYAQPVRTLGPLDDTSRRQFGLDAPRARVILHEQARGGASMRFTIGADVRDERAVYVEYEGRGFVVGRSVADAFLVRARDLRSRNLVEVEVDRVQRIELRRADTTVALVKQGAFFRIDGGERASRAATDALLSDLRELRATRFLEDEASDSTLQRYGLVEPRATLVVTRSARPTVTIRFGAECPEHADEVVVRRDDATTLACVSRASLENATRPVEQLRDPSLLFARSDEVERVVLHRPGAEVTVRRAGDGWTLEGATGEVDADSVHRWIDELSLLRVEARSDLSSAAERGLSPATRWIELSRTGVEGRERIEVGQRDDAHIYARRGDEPVILALSTAAEPTLFVDEARFRPAAVIRDVPEELRALVTEGPGFRDEVTRDAGRWSLIHPFAAGADPVVMRTIAERLASLDAARWVSLDRRTEHGLDRPSGRVIARFEGDGPPGADAGPDGGAPARVREFTLTIGAPAPAGGLYAQVSTRQGVFVLAQSAADELFQPHLERELLSFDRAQVQRIECQQRGQPRFSLRREGAAWRVEGGSAYDRARVEALLESLSAVRAPRVFGYGPSSSTAALGEASIALTLGGDAGTRVLRLTLGREFAGAPSGVYARIDGIDATVSVTEEVSRAVRSCAP